MLLNLISEVGSTRLRRLLDAFGDLERLFSASAKELQQVEGIGPLLSQRIARGMRDETMLRQEMALAERSQIQIVTLDDPEYPKSLKTISDPPLALYVRGTLVASDDVAVGIVGTRHASLYGRQCAERLGYDLALRGVTVVSGLARGIDSAAHQGALKGSGRTIAVLGSGLQCLYPAEHEGLAAEIAQQGAVLSEYPMTMPPLPHNFPRRNRIISGLSLGVVVVEAGQRSGALITADSALEQGREVFAVPGPITTMNSQGTHLLLKQGAKLVTSVEDILEELRLVEQPVMKSRADTADREEEMPSILPEPEQRVFACIEAGQPSDIDTIVSASGLAAAEVSSLLLQLELKQLVHQLPGKRFVRNKS